ncbi:MAG: lipoate--protein ligase family protein [Candidatus Hydrogenedentales bacterium]
MRVLDLSFREPAMNLALDEVLLDSAERGRAGETLRFWECPVPFVVLGVSQKVREEVHESACQKDGIPILRRCSAGGCVLQGPGSLNFSLVLSYERDPALPKIRESYSYILNKIRERLTRRGVQTSHEGISDLALDGRKVSGNAQKRRRQFMLHHGCVLYRADTLAMDRYLREPKDRPEYRGARPHTHFVVNLPLGPEDVRQAVREAFHAPDKTGEPRPDEWAETRMLAQDKYQNPSWTYRR